MQAKSDIINYYDNYSEKRLKWKKRNNYYHKLLEAYYSYLIPENSKVIEIGCGAGELLNAVKPANGVGIDFSQKMVNLARKKFTKIKFYVQDAENIELNEKFDYIIVCDLVGSLIDVQKAFGNLKKISHKDSKIIISNYNYLWEPILKFAELIGLKAKQPLQNWLSTNDILNLLELEGFERIKSFKKILLPIRIPILNFIFNRIVANLPIFTNLSLTNFIISRPKIENNEELSVSIVIPARNERGNIENAIIRTPQFGKSQEFIFIEGNSTDGTYEEILRIKEQYSSYDIVALKQSGKGKGNAVREAFDVAKGDVLMILDADLTTPPEDMPKFYHALKRNVGEFINGCRLVYQMENQAMRFLNVLGNKFFSNLFSFILDQRLKDTLCGTKVLLKRDYEKIKANRSYFGNFDPFGDFDLLFGASKQNLKIVEIPVRYRQRHYGSTQISRFSHGWLLLRMSLFAMKKIKFI